MSDATTADVVDCLRRITDAPGEAEEIGARLWEALTSGRLSVRSHSFSCTPPPYADTPGDLLSALTGPVASGCAEHPEPPASGQGRDQGVKRCRSRGNNVVRRMLSAPVRRAVQRSRPRAKPPCGGIPCAKADR